VVNPSTGLHKYAFRFEFHFTVRSQPVKDLFFFKKAGSSVIGPYWSGIKTAFSGKFFGSSSGNQGDFKGISRRTPEELPWEYRSNMVAIPKINWKNIYHRLWSHCEKPLPDYAIFVPVALRTAESNGPVTEQKIRIHDFQPFRNQNRPESGRSYMV